MILSGLKYLYVPLQGNTLAARAVFADIEGGLAVLRLRRVGKRRGGGKRPSRPASPQRDILCGMYAAGTHRIIDTGECLIENAQARAGDFKSTVSSGE